MDQRSEFRDPKPFLIALAELEPRVAASNLDLKVKQLRTNSLREWREARQAAIFCYGMSQVMDRPIYFCREESQDYDFVASYVVDEKPYLFPVQLKEVVPDTLNATSSVQKIIESLTKYVDSKVLTVAIYLNRQVRFDPKDIILPPLRIGALWVFGAITADQSVWGLWGNFLEQPEGSTFTYPIK